MIEFLHRHGGLVAYLIVAAFTVLALVVYQESERHHQQDGQRKQVCAIERYILKRFEIDKAVPSTPKVILNRRFHAIQELQREVGIRDCGVRRAKR